MDIIIFRLVKAYIFSTSLRKSALRVRLIKTVFLIQIVKNVKTLYGKISDDVILFYAGNCKDDVGI